MPEVRPDSAAVEAALAAARRVLDDPGLTDSVIADIRHLSTSDAGSIADAVERALKRLHGIDTSLVQAVATWDGDAYEYRIAVQPRGQAR